MENSPSPLVSVITVVRNGMPHLPRCVESVFAQTYTNIEYLVIDGLSSDGTSEYIQSLGSRVNKYVREKDLGLYDAMNKGLALAKGEYLIFKNADDWFLPEAIEELINATLQTGADVVYADTYKVWSLEPLTTSILYSKHQELELRSCVDHRNTLIKSEIHKKNLFDSRYRLAADYHLLLKLKLKGYKFHKVNKPLSYMLTGGAGDRATVHDEIFKIQQELLGTGLAWKNLVYSKTKLHLLAIWNKGLRLFLGEEGFRKFKSRKQ